MGDCFHKVQYVFIFIHIVLGNHIFMNETMIALRMKLRVMYF